MFGRVLKGQEGAELDTCLCFYDKSLSDSQQEGPKTPLICLLSRHPLSAPLSPLRRRSLFFDKGLKNEVKRWQSFQPEEHLSPRQGRPTGWESIFTQKTEPQ